MTTDATIYPHLPRVAVGAVIIHQGQALLVLRAKAPAKDVWAIPGGSVRLGEPLQAAAEREALEETGLRIKAGPVIYAFDAIEHDETGRVKYHYVILDLRAEILDATQRPTPGDDARDVKWFDLARLDEIEPISATTRRLLQRIKEND